MTEKPLVSVIINCYNSEKYLRETIDSLIAQKYDNWEAIFWDNCSTDNTAVIIKDYDDNRIRYFYAKEKTSLGKARNLALQEIEGELICFLDSDDLWEPGFLLESVATINMTGVGLVYSRFNFFNEEKSWLAISYQKNGLVPIRRFIESYNVGMSAALFKASYINEYKLCFDNRYSLIEDFDFFIRIAVLSKVYYLQNPLMKYRCHSNNLSHSDKWTDEMNMLLDSVDKDSILFHYKPSLRRRAEIYEYRYTLQSKGRKAAFIFLVNRVFHNYKLIKYLVILLCGESLYKKVRKADE